MCRMDLRWSVAYDGRSAHLAYLSELARSGFVVASIEYRTSNEAAYPKQLEDVKAAIRYLRAHSERYNIDTERFGVMGESAGGYLTAMAALNNDTVYDVGEYTEQSSKVQAACPWYPPTDVSSFPYETAEQQRHLRSLFCLAEMLCATKKMPLKYVRLHM